MIGHISDATCVATPKNPNSNQDFLLFMRFAYSDLISDCMFHIEIPHNIMVIIKPKYHHINNETIIHNHINIKNDIEYFSHNLGITYLVPYIVAGNHINCAHNVSHHTAAVDNHNSLFPYIAKNKNNIVIHSHINQKLNNIKYLYLSSIISSFSSCTSIFLAFDIHNILYQENHR